VVVLGAGFAGITAARDLADAGHSVVLLEAADRIGGRTYSRPFQGRSEIVEFGGAWINQHLQPHMRSEVERYRPAIKTDQAPGHIRFLTGGRLREIPVPPSELRDLERAWLHLYDASKRIAVDRPLYEQEIVDLDLTIDDFFGPLELGPAAREFVYAMATWFIGTDVHTATVLPIIAQTAGFGNSPFGFFGALEERFVGGTRDLLDRMVSGSAVELRLSTPARAVAQTEAGVEVTDAAGQVHAAQACVLAIPTNAMRKLDLGMALGEARRAALKEKHPTRGWKVTALVDGVPTPRPCAIGSGTAHMLLTGSEGEDGKVLITAFGTEPYAPLDVFDLDAVAAAIHEYFPDAEVLACDAHDWNADPLFDGTWRFERAGEGYEFPRLMAEPEGRIFFAGTDVDGSVWRSWMEGALSTSRAAADGVRRLLGAP
jgi:monoamine oxidase